MAGGGAGNSRLCLFAFLIFITMISAHQTPITISLCFAMHIAQLIQGGIGPVIIRNELISGTGNFEQTSAGIKES